MKTIYKYPVVIDDYQEINLPNGAEILTIQQQGGKFYLWAKIDTNKVINKVPIYVFGTGNPINIMEGDIIYISTIQNGLLVWHFFYGTSV